MIQRYCIDSFLYMVRVSVRAECFCTFVSDHHIRRRNREIDAIRRPDSRVIPDVYAFANFPVHVMLLVNTIHCVSRMVMQQRHLLTNYCS